MAQAGGPAAINGFLYQILHHLAWIADIELTGKIAGQDIAGQDVEEAILIFEPCDGGDARCEAEKIRLTEQYKTRSNDTWSVDDIIKKVLPDLRKSVPEIHSGEELYRFVSNGSYSDSGRLKEFLGFCERVHTIYKENKDFRQLDAQIQRDFFTSKKKFKGQVIKTDCDLFNYIVAETKPHEECTRADEYATVFHLLAHFKMEFGVTAEECSDKVEKLLSRYVEDLEDERGKREQLIGILMEHLSKIGHLSEDKARLKVDDLLKKAKLNPERMRNLARLSETTATFARKNVRDWFKYSPEMDVRAGCAVDWPADKSVLLITGDSGSGKSWQLARLVTLLGEQRQFVVMGQATSTYTADSLLGKATNKIWQDGLGETHEKTPTALTLHYQKLEPKAKWPWLTIAIDDVQDVEVARELIRKNWPDWGMRLVMTVPSAVANSLREERSVKLLETESFTIDEVDELLKRHEKKWRELPPDLKKLLCTPVLAGIYVKLSVRSIRTAPDSEYEIFDSYWKDRILGDRKQSNYPGDEGIVLALAGRVLDKHSYPCKRQDWNVIGLNDEALNRLKMSGWLNSEQYGKVAFAHDRLLNWAVAKELTSRFEDGFASEQLADLFIECNSFSRPYPFVKELHYVTMNTLWLLTADLKNIQAATEIVSRLEKAFQYGSYGSSLYKYSLPTLGQRIVPVLLARLDSIIAEREGDYRTSLISKGLTALAFHENVDLTETVERLLNTSSPDRQKVAMDILKNKPMSSFLERVWKLHQGYYISQNWVYLVYSSPALHACIQADPKWLRQKILQANDPSSEPVSELAYELYRLNDYSQALAIWHETKEILCHKLFLDNTREWPLVSAQTILFLCIRRFSDSSYIVVVIDGISSTEDFTRSAAFTTLAYLAPNEAMRLFFEVNESELVLSRKRWLPILLRVRPKETRANLLDYAEKVPQGSRLIAGLFGERSDELDELLLGCLLRGLEKEMADNFELWCREEPHIYLGSLNCPAGVARPDLLKILAQEADGNLERMLTEIACSRIPKIGSNHDSFLDAAKRLLFKIDGKGFTTLVNYELKHASHPWVRYRGLEWAMKVPPNGETISLLAQSACRHLTTGEKLDDHEYQLAILALAALGADKVLVDTFLKTGSLRTNPDLARLRFSNQPMDKTVTEQARQILETSETKTEKELLLAVIVAWISADSDFISLVRPLLSRAKPNSLTARFACMTLQQLKDESAEFVELLKPLLETENNKDYTIHALFGLGEKAIEPLRQYLKMLPVDKWKYQEQRIIEFLHQQKTTQGFAEEVAAQYCVKIRNSSFGLPYDIASRTNKPEIREMIYNEVFGKESSDSSLRAIKGLANFDSHRAVQVIEDRLLQGPSFGEWELCQLLVRLVPKTAASKLLEIALSVQREDKKREDKKKENLYLAIGQALRRLDAQEVDSVLGESLKNTQRDTRAIAAKLAGWLPPGRLSESLDNLADNEMEETVRRATLEALARQQRENTVLALMKVFPTADRQRRWVLLHCILEIGDPFLLTHREELIWLGKILSDVPFYIMPILN